MTNVSQSARNQTSGKPAMTVESLMNSTAKMGPHGSARAERWSASGRRPWLRW